MNAHPTGFDSFMATLSEVLELPRYLVTLAAHGLTAGVARWFLAFVAWTALGWFVDAPFTPGLLETLIGWLPHSFSSGLVAFLFAVGPLAWSASAFWRPGEGRIWHERVGAFDPSEEEAEVIDAALAALGREATHPLTNLSIYVIDTNDKFAFVRGQALILSRALVESESLPAVLAHELNHARSTDGRLMQALDRLVLWGDPLVRARDEDTRREYGGMAALVSGGLRWLLRIAGGSLTMRCMAPLWAPYWRRRERAADESAVDLGQGPALAQYLKDWEQPKERPHPRLLFNLQQYERIAYRRDVLQAAPRAHA